MKKLNEAWEMYKKQAITVIVATLCSGSVGAGLSVVNQSKLNPAYVYDKLELHQKEIKQKFSDINDSLAVHSHEMKKQGIRIDSLVVELKHQRQMDSLRDAWRDSIIIKNHQELMDRLDKRKK